jgi:hypothetical protein
MRVLQALGISAFVLAVFGLAAVTAHAQPAPAKPVPGSGTAYRITADVVTSGTKPGIQGVPCVNQSTFFPGDVIVFRAVIADGPTGVALTPADVAQRGLLAVVTLADGTKIPVTLKNHPPPPNAPAHESYWSGALLIKPDHPTGTLPWTLSVTDNQGRTGTFTPAGQTSGAAMLTIVPKGPAAAQ